MTDHPAPLTALLDGTLLPPEAPLLRPDDLGVLRGEGVFETTLVVDGVARDLDDHLARLAISAEMTGLVVPAPGAVPGSVRVAPSVEDVAPPMGAVHVAALYH
jgi:hypothetical protein